MRRAEGARRVGRPVETGGSRNIWAHCPGRIRAMDMATRSTCMTGASPSTGRRGTASESSTLPTLQEQEVEREGDGAYLESRHTMGAYSSYCGLWHPFYSPRRAHMPYTALTPAVTYPTHDEDTCSAPISSCMMAERKNSPPSSDLRLLSKSTFGVFPLDSSGSRLNPLIDPCRSIGVPK